MKSSHRVTTQKTSIFKRWMSFGVLTIATLSPLLAFSGTANAGLFSFVAEMFGSQEASAKVETTSSGSTSQKIALLQAAVNPDPNPHKAGEVLPVNGDVLVPDLAAADAIGGSDELNTQISVYTVREGDNLSTIAQMFGVSVNTIMWANDIARSSSIQVGQTLVILPVSGINYKVQKGDTIRGIVAKYKADLDEVLSYNGLSVDSTLAVGDTIIIPDAELQTVTPTRTTSNTASVPSGYYMRPIKIGVRSQGVHGHNGVDLAAPVGTPIYASAGGRVIASVTGGWNGGYGNYVIISHANGTQTLYAHTAKNFVALGQVVEKGGQIASIGMTGKTTGPHVHFEIRGARNPF
jgi:murein DD-endopeptidase MepM/ murein hydrolase activator NlpD